MFCRPLRSFESSMDYLPGRVCCLLKLYEHSSKTLVKGLKTDETEVLMKTLDIQVSIHQENGK